MSAARVAVLGGRTGLLGVPLASAFRALGYEVAALGRARTMEAHDGFANVYADANGKITRISIMAPHATELIAWASLAIDRNLSVEEFLHPHYTHPTLTEMLKEAAEDLMGLSVHKA